MRTPSPDPLLADVPPTPMTMLAAAQALWRDLPRAISDRVHLFSLELRHAASALAVMVMLGVVAVLCLGTAWLALWVGIWLALTEAADLGWLAATAIVFLLNLGAAAGAGFAMKPLAGRLTLPRTMRHLTVAATPEAADGEPPLPDVDHGADAGATAAAPDRTNRSDIDGR
jgi:uncharacterized membrane protein YqjE